MSVVEGRWEGGKKMGWWEEGRGGGGGGGVVSQLGGRWLMGWKELVAGKGVHKVSLKTVIRWERGSQSFTENCYSLGKGFTKFH